MMVRLENEFNKIDEKIVFLEQKLDTYHRDMERAKADFEKPFEHEEELQQKLKRQFEINAELDLDKSEGAKEENFDADRTDIGEEHDVYTENVDRKESEETYGIAVTDKESGSIR